MKIYSDLISQLDSGGAHYSQDLSEVDLSDPDDVKVAVSDSQGEVLVHLGSSNYLDRYKVYVSHVQQWRQQFSKLDSVDLRYDRQVIVNPDLGGTARQPSLSLAAARNAMAVGVKPAALVTHERPVAKPLATVAPRKAAKKPAKPAVNPHANESKAPNRRPAAKKATGPPKPKSTAKHAPPKPHAEARKRNAGPPHVATTASKKKPSPEIRAQDQQ